MKLYVWYIYEVEESYYTKIEDSKTSNIIIPIIIFYKNQTIYRGDIYFSCLKFLYMSSNYCKYIFHH